MPAIRIAAAQCPSIAGDIQRNISIHNQMLAAAVEEKIELLIFPELSLTGYEPAFADRCKLQLNDPRLNHFRQTAHQHQMTIVVGAPIDVGSERPMLGSIIFSPLGVSSYFKQHLHSGEELFFQAGSTSSPIKVKNLPVSLAICADTNHPEHAQAAANNDAIVYGASVMFSDSGYAADTTMLQAYARQHQMAVLMANHNSPTGGWHPAGKSTIWNPQGEVLCQAVGTEAALIIGQQKAQQWEGSVKMVTLNSELQQEEADALC